VKIPKKSEWLKGKEELSLDSTVTMTVAEICQLVAPRVLSKAFASEPERSIKRRATFEERWWRRKGGMAVAVVGEGRKRVRHMALSQEEVSGDVQKVVTIATIRLLVNQNRGIGRAEEDDIYWFSKAGREGVVHLLQEEGGGGEDAKTFKPNFYERAP
jgi:hypothetical protein